MVLQVSFRTKCLYTFYDFYFDVLCRWIILQTRLNVLHFGLHFHSITLLGKSMIYLINVIQFFSRHPTDNNCLYWCGSGSLALGIPVLSQSQHNKSQRFLRQVVEWTQLPLLKKHWLSRFWNVTAKFCRSRPTQRRQLNKNRRQNSKMGGYSCMSFILSQVPQMHLIIEQRFVIKPHSGFSSLLLTLYLNLNAGWCLDVTSLTAFLYKAETRRFCGR